MSRITISRLMPLFLRQDLEDGVMGLLREMIVLQFKLDNLEKQDFYFQKGKENHIVRLESLKEKYAQLVKIVNNNDVNFFLQQIIGKEDDIRKIALKRGLSTHDQIALQALQGHISEYKNILDIKGKMGVLMPIDELMANENMLKVIFS